MIHAESREAVEHARIGFAASGSCVARPSAPARGSRRRTLHLYRFSDFDGRRCARRTPERINQGFAAGPRPRFAPSEAGPLAFRPLRRSGQAHSVPLSATTQPLSAKQPEGCIVTT